MIQKVIREAFSTSTVITIAHVKFNFWISYVSDNSLQRLRTIMDYDQIIVMGAGMILEMGSPEELLAKEGGAFAELVRTND